MSDSATPSLAPSARARALVRGLAAGKGGLRELRHLAVAQIAPLPMQVALSLLTAVVLLPDARGSAVFVVGTGAVGASIAFGSFHVGAVAALKAGDRAAVRRVVLAVLAVAGVFAAAAGVVAATGWAGPGLYSAGNLVLICTGLALNVLVLNLNRTVQGLGDSGAYRWVALVMTAVYAGGAAVALVGFGLRTAAAVTLPWLASLVVALVLAAVLCRRTVRRLPPVDPPRRVEALRASLAAHGGSVSQQLAYRADLFLLGVWSTAAAVGVYTLSVSLAEMVWIVPEVIALSVFADDAVRSGGDWRATVQRRIRSVLLVTAGTAVLLVAAAAVLLLLLIPEYRAGFPLLLVLVPGMVLAAAGRVVVSALTARDQRALLRRAAVGTLALSLLYVPAIAMFDVLGAAVASPLVYVGQYLLLRRLWARAT
jgi:O-antigen/teichoic acid export membrane protein